MEPNPPALSPVALFLDADPVVQGVVVLLAAASVGVWTIAFDRAVRVARLHRGARALDALARGGRGAVEAAAPAGLAVDVLDAARAAARERVPDEGPGERRERPREAMRLALADALASAQVGLPFLATVASAAPFVGLFGTVWGIMRAFAAIARTAVPRLARQPDPVVVTLDGAGRIFLREEAVPEADPAGRLGPMARAAPDAVVYIRADGAIPYRRVAEVMGAVAAAGFARASLLAESAPAPAAK